MRIVILGAFALAAGVFGADRVSTKEQPVGLVLSAGGSKLRRADTETSIASRAGDLLFSGDTLKTESDPASFVFCPAKTIDTMAPSSEVRLEATKPKVKIGKLSEQPARTCILPQTLRIAIASQQHYGVTMTRGTNQTDVPPIPRDKLAGGCCRGVSRDRSAVRRIRRSSRPNRCGSGVREARPDRECAGDLLQAS